MISKNIVIFLKYLKLFFSKERYSFLTYDYSVDLKCLKNSKIDNNDFEKYFLKQLNYEGEGISFASGRMCLYSILKTLNLKTNDEVVILGFTCSVVINAILRTSATPVFYDLDVSTLGSSLEEISKKITSNTKVVIAQHSFGIPCNITNIVDFLKNRNIFLIEDCALTFGSKVENRYVGTFGDAAFFSFDHTKPINSAVGGILLIKNKNLYDDIYNYFYNLDSIPEVKQKEIKKNYLFEREYFKKNKHGKFYLFNFLFTIKRKLFQESSPYLDQEYSAQITSNIDYSYPSKIPDFSKIIAKNILSVWPEISVSRKKILNLYIDFFIKKNMKKYIPEAYFNNKLDIVPLRFILLHDKANQIKNDLKNIIDVNSFWFMEPIIAINEPLENYQYKIDSCPKSELIGKMIINFPTSLNLCDATNLINTISKINWKKYE